MTAHYQAHGDVAVITLNNPPVNGLGLATRLGITAGLERAHADSAVQAIVITGAGKAFSGGADINEFDSPLAYAEPNLLSVIRAVESASKPVVAALHSVAMGGGLELALGCHYRIAAPGTSVALRLTLGSAQATLTEEQIETTVAAIVAQLASRLGARQRA